MAHGIGENPARSPSWVITQLEFPTSRDEIVETAGEFESPAEVINFLKCLPREQYGSQEEVLRDFAEAERRFGVMNADGPSREDLNRHSPHP